MKSTHYEPNNYVISPLSCYFPSMRSKNSPRHFKVTYRNVNLWSRIASKQNWKSVIRTGIHTCVLCKFWIINKRLRQVSCLGNFTFQLLCTNNAVLMASLSNINQYRFVIGCVSSVVAYWSRTRDRILDKSKHFLSCSNHVIILH
jgi:hypothetical protein